MIKEGNYDACVEKILVTTAQSGNPQMEIVVFIDENTRKTIYMPLTEKAMASFVAETLESVGFNGDFGAPAFDPKFYADYCLPVWCKHETYQDKPVERWNISRGGSRNPEAGGDIISRLNAKYRALAGSKPQTKPTGAPPAPPPRSGPPPAAAPAETEDDFNKDRAWETLAEQASKLGKEVDTKEWHAAIKRVGTNEDDFGPAEWRKVVEEYVPF